MEEKFQKALNEFVEEQKKDKNVIGIIVSGSIIHSKPDKNSDLDVFIVTNNNVKTRIRGNTWRNGIEIEYFKNPVKQVREYFKKEIGKKSPCTAHMLANSIILYKKNNQLNKLIKEAKIRIKKQQEKISKFELEQERYFLDDIEKDLEDVYLRKDEFAFEQISAMVLDRALKDLFIIKRTYPEKPKRLLPFLEKLDNKFAELYKQSLLEKDINKKYEKLISLIRYTEKLLGGKRPREWKLKSVCPIFKKSK